MCADDSCSRFGNGATHTHTLIHTHTSTHTKQTHHHTHTFLPLRVLLSMLLWRWRAQRWTRKVDLSPLQAKACWYAATPILTHTQPKHNTTHTLSLSLSFANSRTLTHDTHPTVADTLEPHTHARRAHIHIPYTHVQVTAREKPLSIPNPMLSMQYRKHHLEVCVCVCVLVWCWCLCCVL